MRVFWEQTGVLLPIYRLAAKGLSDCDIAAKLSITELKVSKLHGLAFAFTEND
jgi:hypothetical protein